MSRSTTTLSDWMDVDDSSQGDAGEEPESEQALTGADWQPKQPQCECGVPVEEWHATAEARRMVRIYGDSDAKTVPVCPACVDWTNCSHRQHEDTIPHAVKELEASSSIERCSKKEIVLQEVRDE